MNVLSGQYPYGSYTGTVTYEGEECKFKNLNDSEAKGIVIIHQELALIPLLSIGENMFLGNEIKNKSGSIRNVRKKVSVIPFAPLLYANLASIGANP